MIGSKTKAWKGEMRKVYWVFQRSIIEKGIH